MPEGGYLDLILRQTEELCKNYNVDGFWYDIIPNNVLNYNEFSREEMKKAGIDINDDEAVNKHHVEKIKFFMASCNKIIKKYHPDASIFYNWSTHMSNSNSVKHRMYDYDTSCDLEDLPTTWAGYDVFPLRAKYFANEERPMTGMSGKFHTSWGEFGGFKYPNALKYESASMMAFGANVNFGDQLHPSGQIDPETYNNIGVAYTYEPGITKGSYVFKVSLAGNLWRKIELSHKHSLLDLHNAIQDAFDFDDDHLYSFFMDAKRYSRNAFNSPFTDEGPYVDEISIGELELYEGHRILYLFDYGDSWEFNVLLEKIDKDSPLPVKPKVTEIKGKAPEQYRSFE